MGASPRTIALICCVALLGPQVALAESEGWLERVASLTRSVIPDLNLATYLDRDQEKDAGSAIPETGFAGNELGVVASEPRSIFNGDRYSVRVIDSDATDTWNSSSSGLLERDAAADPRVGGLGRSAVSDQPAPMYGVDLAVSVSGRWTLGMRGRIVDTASSDIDTSMSAYSAALEYAAKEKLSFGFGYEQFETYADAQLSATSGYVSYRYSGPRVYTTVRF